MRRVWKHWRLLAILAVAAALAAVATWPAPVTVDLVPVTRGAMTVTVDDEGETRVKERFAITAPLGGELQRIALEPGDPVTRGEVLARITSASPALLDARTRAELAGTIDAAQAAVGQAQAERRRADAALERAQSSLRRVQELLTVGGVSRDEVEAAETVVRTSEESRRAADFVVRRAESNLQTARARLRQPTAAGRVVEVVSPIDGVVLRRARESAGIVQTGELLLEVGDAGRLEIVADFLSTDAVRIQPGQRVVLEQWGGGQELDGRVQRVEPSGFMKVSALGVEEQRVNVIIDFEPTADADGRLGDGYRVETRVVVWEQPSVLKVPVGALLRNGEDWAVFVAEGNRARRQTIVVGQRNDREAEVRDGLAEGAMVILHPPDTLDAGVAIATRVP